MIYDAAIYDTVAEVLKFHFVTCLGNDMPDPTKYYGFALHGAGSTSFLHHD